MTFSNLLYLHDTFLACGAALLFFFSYVLLSPRFLVKTGESAFAASCKLLGYATLTFAVLLLVLWVIVPQGLPSGMYAAWNLMCIHFGSVLVCMAYGNLVNQSYVSKKQMTRDFGCWLLNVVLIWVSALCLQGTAQLVLCAITDIIYMVELCRMVLSVKSSCAQAVLKLENFFSEWGDDFVAWVKECIYVFSGIGVLGIQLIFLPQVVHVLYLIILLVSVSYFFKSFVGQILMFPSICSAIKRVEELQEENEEQSGAEEVASAAAPSDEEAEAEKASEEEGKEAKEEEFSTTVPRETEDKASLTERLLRDNLDKWIMRGGYLDQGMTLEGLASEIMTNRTYLSSYINNTYNCTFKEFIYMLRIEAAIQIMMEEPNISIDDLGTRVGIPSASTFNRQFVKQMGVTPAVWKMSNLQKRS